MACDLIRSRAEAAIASLADARPPSITLPATMTLNFRNADLADIATWITGVTRTGDTTVEATDAGPIRLYRTFVHIVLLTRDIAE